MTITSTKPRRDGKLLVSIVWSNGVNRRKVWTSEQLAEFKAKHEPEPPHSEPSVAAMRSHHAEVRAASLHDAPPAPDPFAHHYAQLLGKTVVGIVQDPAGDTGAIYGLKFDSGDIAWIQCDPEGNGPGFLDIQRG